MPEGITNAPAAFQWFMDDIFTDMINIIVIIYLEDILIYQADKCKFHIPSFEFHIPSCEFHIPSYEFHIPSCEYLRYMLSPKGLTMAHTKSRSSKIGPYHRKSRIFNLSSASPTFTIVSLWIFQNHHSTYASYLQGYPLAFLQWVSILPLKHLKGFHHSSGPYPLDSRHSNYSRDWHLQLCTHCCPFNHNSWWWVGPNCIPLQTFSTLELNYHVNDKELLAIFEAFKWWWHYLKGSGLPINMFTDHQYLQFFSTTKILTHQQAH